MISGGTEVNLFAQIRLILEAKFGDGTLTPEAKYDLVFRCHVEKGRAVLSKTLTRKHCQNFELSFKS